MFESRLNEIKALKKKATVFRNRGKFHQALGILEEATDGLGSLAKQNEVDKGLTLKINAELADIFGMKGGIFRRLNQPDSALTQYKEGWDKENRDEYSTYNLSNVITLSITLKKSSPTDPEIHQYLEESVTRLEKATKGPRYDDWWAWADLGQSYLLLNQLDKARQSYRNGKNNAGPTSAEYVRHIDVLRELASSTAEKNPDISHAIEEAIQEIEHLVS